MAFRLAHFSDIHLTTAPAQVPWRALLSKRVFGWVNLALMGRYSCLRDAAAVTAAFVRDIESEQPDHVLFTGDATGLSLEPEFHEARRVLLPLLESGRLTGIPGNHDVYTRSSARQEFYEKHLGEWEHSDRPEAPPIIRLLGERLALFCLKDSRPTAFYDSSGKVGEEQLRRLERYLEDPRLESRRRILALHYAPRRADGRPDTRHHGLRDAEELLDIAQRGKVDLIVHGHLHQRFVLPAGASTPVPLANPGSLTYSACDRAYHIYGIDDRHIRIDVRRFDQSTGSFVGWPEASATDSF